MKKMPAALTLGLLVGLAVGHSLAAAASEAQKPFKGPLKVFILAGQSNMEGLGGIRTLDALGEHPTHGHLLKKIKHEDGSFVVRDDVFVSYQRGPEKIKRPLTVGMGAWGPEWHGPGSRSATIRAICITTGVGTLPWRETRSTPRLLAV